jgi:CHAD domain-containing protein
MNLEVAVAEFFTAGRQALSSEKPEELHTFRIAAKRLRYTIELTDPDGAAEHIARLKELQEILGNMNDAFVAERYLMGLPTLSARARALPGKLHEKAHRHILEFRRYWTDTFDAEGEEEAWLLWARSL